MGSKKNQNNSPVKAGCCGSFMSIMNVLLYTIFFQFF